MEYLLGIDIGGTHVKGGIVTGTTGKMDQRTIVYEKIDAGGSATSIIKGILRVITALKKGRSEKRMAGYRNCYTRAFRLYPGNSCYSWGTKIRCLIRFGFERGNKKGMQFTGCLPERCFCLCFGRILWGSGSGE